MHSKMASELHDYIRERASVENTGFNLTPEFFDKALASGVRQFFGVKVENGKMISDDQEPWPGFLDAWKNGG